MAKANTVKNEVKAVDAAVVEVAAPARNPKTKDLALALFQASPNKEIATNDVIAAVQKHHSTVKTDTLKYALTELRKASIIHETRKIGLQSILKLGKHPGAKLAVSTRKVTAMTPSAAETSDVAILEEASAVIAQLQALVNRNLQALEQMARLKAVLT